MSAPIFSSSLLLLRRADQRLRALVPHPRSLAPHRPEARSLESIGLELFTAETSPDRARAFAEALSRILAALHDHFPETIFWDVDFLASSLFQLPDPDTITEAADLIVSLQQQYGRHSIIAFRYVHDFIYGFDWAKWIKKDPASRSTVRPFDLIFLRYLCTRGKELVELIHTDDEKYPKLPDGRPRNPFGFSREPAEEEQLHRHLASLDLIPLPAWQLDAHPRWEPPYQLRRQEVALELQIPTRQNPDS